MRVLHTSDWHLGRSFGDFRLLDDQRAFIEWLVATVRAEQVDLVVVAGDLFDRAIPPVEAVELFRTALIELRAAGAMVVAIAGNHDSAERIGVFDGLVDDGLVIRGGYSRAADVEVLDVADGPLAVVAAPFLDPLLAPSPTRSALHGDTESDARASRTQRLSHEAVLSHALAEARASIPASMRSLVVAHAFVTGAAPSDSERDLAVGEAGMVSASVFAGFDYVALGHLHRPQRVGGKDHIVYSGSPLPYSFSEAHAKSIMLVDMDPDGAVSCTERIIPVGRKVATVRGSLEDLLDARPTDDFVRVELLDAGVVPDAHRRLRPVFPHLVEIARAGRTAAPVAQLTVEDTIEATPSELALTFFAEVTGTEALLAERQVLTTALDPAVIAADIRQLAGADEPADSAASESAA